VSLHVRLASRKPEVPPSLLMANTAVRAPLPLDVMFPIVPINVTSLRLRLVHAIETQAAKMVGDLLSSPFNRTRVEL
jgi:hypothetical protein